VPYREYTHCVQPADYVDDTPPDSTLAFLLELFLDPTALARWASTACPYLLGGKLVCLGDGADKCAIGRITKFELPSDKSFPGNIDNDYSMNLLLAPHNIDEMTGPSYIDNYNKIVGDGMQGWLIQEQPGMPSPHQAGDKDDNGDPPDPVPSPSYQGYFTKYPDSNYPDYDPAQSPFQVPGSDGHPFYVPCLHVECEGSRINDVCAAINGVLGPVSGFCEIPIIGWIACFVVALAMAPILTIAIAAAWANAIDGDQADDRIDGGGTLNLGDMIVVTGRWAYDAAHQGWNELHPVKTIQLVTNAPDGSDADFTAWYDRWCGAIAQTPPYEGAGQRPTGMTAPQAVTYENQTEPQNQWIFHPMVDGCLPPPPQPPPIR
jgi:hypothetical protein